MDTKYFNNAGAGLMSAKTFETIVEHMRLEMSIGANTAANEKREDISNFYSASAQVLHAESPEEIAFIDSASRGWNLIMYGLNITSSDTIVTLSSEYGTNLLTITDISCKTGCSVKIIPCEATGRFDISTIEDALKSGGTILAISHVAAQGSIVNPVVELGRIASKYNAIYIVDGCQAVGQIKVDVQEIQCAAYITAGRKWLRGPRGTGILYVKKGSPIRTPQIDLASADLVFNEDRSVSGISIRKDAKQFELWEKNTASLLGLTNAIYEYLSYGEEKANIQISRKGNEIRNAICENPKLRIVGEKYAPVGTASFYLRSPHFEEIIKKRIAAEGFIISNMGNWDCPISFPQNGASTIFRISPHYYTSEDEIQSLKKLILEL